MTFITFSERSLRVLALSEGSSLNDLETELSRLPADALRSASGFGFRVTRQFVQDAESSLRKELRRVALRRSYGKPIYLVWLDELWEAQVSRLTEEGVCLESSDLVPMFRYADLLATVMDAGPSAFLRATESYHFVSPSLKHTKLFLRVGDAICSRKALDTLAFWCCPLVARCHAVVVDTWSISSVPLLAMQYAGKRIPLDCLPAHPLADFDAARGVLAGVLEALGREAPVLFLTSIVGDGDAVSAIKVLLSDLGFSDCQCHWAALYGFANSPEDGRDEIFCRLDEEYKAFERARCDWCEAGSLPVTINSKVYHVDIGREQQVRLNPESLRGHRAFIESYGNLHGFLGAHRDDPNDGRHHAFYTDVLVLLGNENFRHKLVETLNACQCIPQLVVAPDHAPGRVLARVAAEHFGIPEIIHNDLRRDRLGSDEISLLNAAGNIIIVDDVLKTGSRLSEFTRSLREGRYTAFNSVEYLVAIARPESEEKLTSIRGALTKYNTAWKASLRWVENIFLPEWHDGQCPWCKERDALGRVGEALPRPPEWLKARMGQLCELSRGLLLEPFLLPPGQKSLPLGTASEIGPEGLSPIGTLFSLAAGLQGLRTSRDDKVRLELRFPIFRSFAPSQLTGYSEALVRQCFLRLIKAEEWPERTKAEPSEAFSSQFDAQPCLLGEFLLAMSRRSFKPVLDDKIVNWWRDNFLLELRELKLLVDLPASRSGS